MPAQRAGLSESLPANFAHEWSSACVYGHVAGQVVVRVKDLNRRGGEPETKQINKQKATPCQQEKYNHYYFNNNNNKIIKCQPTTLLS